MSRYGKRLVALGALIASLFKRATKKKVIDVPLRDVSTNAAARGPSLRGNGKMSRALRQTRRRRLAVSFTRVLAHRPMFTAPYGKERKDNPRDVNQLDRCAEWSEAIDAYRRHWARARADSMTMVRGREGLVRRG